MTQDVAHILVVDDDDRIRDLLKRYLTREGYRVTSAPDAAGARKMM
ncbi:MAG TPA: DNA-binding response regulator, partial [Hyphomonas atlantica]|nr:DNA-binding response regulator [Hyphomonas atlantica]